MSVWSEKIEKIQRNNQHFDIMYTVKMHEKMFYGISMTWNYTFNKDYPYVFPYYTFNKKESLPGNQINLL